EGKPDWLSGFPVQIYCNRSGFVKQRSWLAILLSFAGPCRGKLVLSVICAIISVAGGFVPYLGVYEILRLFIHQSASGMELLRWAGVCLAGYGVKVAF